MKDAPHSDFRILIDPVVRLFTVMIAALATSGRERSSLFRVRDQVFMNLTDELAQQGVSSRVIASMLGLSLSAYYETRQRYTESLSYPGRYLWGLVFEFVRERTRVTRGEVIAEFHRDKKENLGSILRDLVQQEILAESGKGEDRRYHYIAEDLEVQERAPETLQQLVWVNVLRLGEARFDEVLSAVPIGADLLSEALRVLENSGRIECIEDGAHPRYRSAVCLLPYGEASGAPAALLDHLHGVVGTVCAKLRSGRRAAYSADETGASTYRFDVHPQHPHYEEVVGLLRRTREEVGEVWDRVRAHNESQPATETLTPTVFYFGQLCMRDEEGTSP